MPNPAEVAQLIVRGESFEDWETVMVQHRWSEGWPTFRFTAAENNENMPKYWQDLKFKPGDPCQIVLGGELAFGGTILKRQVAYDATSHAVELSGVGYQWSGATSSVPEKINNFDNMNIVQIATKLLTGQHGVPVKVVGEPSMKPFEQMQAHPGELIFDFLDRLGRHRMTVLGSDHEGNFLLIGLHTAPIVQQLIEGQNIKKMQCIIVNEGMYRKYSGTGQATGNDQRNMRKSAELEAQAEGSIQWFRRFLQVPMEHPVPDASEVAMRVNFQAIESEGTEITATVTVQGWLRDGGNLWAPGTDVYVYSPMALLNLVMKIKVCTFTQDSQRGTQTELELVLPWRLLGKRYEIEAGVVLDKDGNPIAPVPTPPADAKTTSDKPAVAPPPAQSTDPTKPGYIPAPPISTDNMPPQPAPPSPPISY